MPGVRIFEPLAIQYCLQACIRPLSPGRSATLALDVVRSSENRAHWQKSASRTSRLTSPQPAKHPCDLAADETAGIWGRDGQSCESSVLFSMHGCVRRDFLE